MPPKNKRLETKDFKTAQKSTTYRSDSFDVKILYNNKAKFACVIKNSVAKTAVNRNKARRKVYSVLVSVFKDEKNSVIAYPKKQALTTKKEILTEEMFQIKKGIKNI